MLREKPKNRAIMEILRGASHVRTNRPHENLTVPAWQGVYSTPLHPRDQWEPSCPPLEPPEQEPSRPCTLDRDASMTRISGMTASQPKELSRSLGTHRPLFRRRHRPKGFHAPWNPDRGFRAPDHEQERVGPCTLTKGG